MIELLSVTYSYPSTLSRQALSGLSLQVPDGQFVAVLGQNGSGKSTMARMLNGLLLPTSGSVTVDGMPTSDADAVWNIRSCLGMVFHNPESQIVATTVEEDVAFGLENLGVVRKEMRERIYEALETVGLAGMEMREPHLLSGGQKQRLAIAGVLAMRPRHLVLDEATSMLDGQSRSEVLSTLHELNGKGMTVVLITHFIEEALLAERIVVLKEGRVALDGSPGDLLPNGPALRDAGVLPPFAVEAAEQLRAKGMELPPGIYRNQQLVDVLCRSS